MKISVSELQGRIPVTVMQFQGDVDASNYKRLIDKARDIYSTGVRALVLDLSEMPFMGSSGLVALHSIAVLLQGGALPDPDAGWGALHAIDRERSAGLQKCVKLFNPQPRVDRMLRMAGFDQFFEIYTDLEAAVASF
jgi:anti-anti-sigma regulatory factor